MKDDLFYLIHIDECIQKIESYTCDGRDAFLESTMQQDAAIRNFEIMGEATKHLSSQLRESYPGVPWRRIAGFRDVLIHNYIGVDINEVWVIIERDLPYIKSELRMVLREIKSSRKCD